MHDGSTPAECPVCRPMHDRAARLLNAKTRKVYGRITANARREHAANQRSARAIFDRLFREHTGGGEDDD